MKKWFYIGVAGIVLFEVANVYFIMPMPGSQRMESVQLAWFLNHWKWIFRGVFYLSLVAGLFPALKSRWWLAALGVILAGWVSWVFNAKMTASSMFREMKTKTFITGNPGKTDSTLLVLGLEINGDARAYPVEYIAYHHRVFDTVGGRPVMVTYCSVCRTGRVFDPVRDKKMEHFRLVGMDHFNAMFEDKTTGSWWRQENGEAVAGPLKGQFLGDIPCVQMQLSDWLKLHPKGKVLQGDPAFAEKYKKLRGYDNGSLKSSLIGIDTGNWNEKSWVVGLLSKKSALAVNWNDLKKQRAISDTISGRRFVLWISGNQKNFYAFYLPSHIKTADSLHVNPENALIVRDDFIIYPDGMLGWRHSGKTEKLEAVDAYQEFWHSWRTFHGPAVYKPAKK